MANIQIINNGSAVTFSFLQYQPYTAGQVSPNQFSVCGVEAVLPAVGGTVSVSTGSGTFLVTRGSGVFDDNGYGYPILSVKVSAGVLGTGYLLTVGSIGAGGNVSQQTAVDGALFDITGPPPPAAPSAPTFGTPSSTSVPVNVPALPTGATGLNLQRSLDNSAWATVPNGTNVPPQSVFTDTGLSPQTTYDYRFVATSTAGATPGPSGQVTTAATPPPAPGAPAAPTFGTPTQTTLPVTFPALPAGATSFALQQSINGQDWATVSAYAPATPGGTGTLTGLTAGTTYYGRMLATGPGGTTPGTPSQATTAGVNPTGPLSALITSPAANAPLQGIAVASVQADGGTGGVAKVELYVSGNLVDTKTVPQTPPDVFLLHWDSTAAGNGLYTLVAKAYDHAAPPNVAVSASVLVNAENPDRLSEAYFFSPPWPAQPGSLIASLVPTLDVIPSADKRTLRELQVGISTVLTSANFEADYPLVALNEDYVLPSPSAQVRLGVKLVPPFVVGPFTFTENIVKMVPSTMLPSSAGALIWGASGKLYAFDGISAPALVLDTATILLPGETLQDVAVFGGRVFLALSGGPAPLASRVFAYDPAPGYESDTQIGLPGTASALTATATVLFLGTTEGYVHQMDAGGRLKKVCGGTTPALPHGVASLLAVKVTSASSPGVLAILTDGSAWNLDGTAAQYGATEVFLPPDGAATSAVVADETYLGSAGGGLYALGTAGFTLAYPFPSGVSALASYAGTVYAGLSGDGRLWGKTLSPGQNALAYGPVTDPLGAVTGGAAGLTSITSLITIGTALYIGGTAAGGINTLYEFNAPAASPLGVFGQSFAHPALEVRAFQ